MHLPPALQWLKEKGIQKVILGVSTGKDSTALGELLHQHGFEICAYYLYFVPDVSFRERYLAYLERRWGIEILRLPHPDLGLLLQDGFYCEPQPDFPKVTFPELYAAVRERFGVDWIVNGEKKVDSPHRRMMIGNIGYPYVSEPRRVAFPLADWKEGNVFAYLKMRGIPVGPDYALFGYGWGGMVSNPYEARVISERYPEDFERFKALFPGLEAMLERWDYEVSKHKARQKVLA